MTVPRSWRGAGGGARTAGSGQRVRGAGAGRSFRAKSGCAASVWSRRPTGVHRRRPALSRAFMYPSYRGLRLRVLNVIYTARAAPGCAVRAPAPHTLVVPRLGLRAPPLTAAAAAPRYEFMTKCPGGTGRGDDLAACSPRGALNVRPSSVALASLRLSIALTILLCPAARAPRLACLRGALRTLLVTRAVLGASHPPLTRAVLASLSTSGGDALS